jgi:hypothetical protein
MVKCKVCNKEFKNDGGLHRHIKTHELSQAEYYQTYHRRESLYEHHLIPFENKKQYFAQDFIDCSEFEQWCFFEKPEVVKPYVLKRLKGRMEETGQAKAPCHLELLAHQLPSALTFKRLFGSYSEACRQAQLEPLFKKGIPKDYIQNLLIPDDLSVFIDTREQQPLNFQNSQSCKLDFGDYAPSQNYFDYTFVDRKSTGDLMSTLSESNLDRFRSELERAKQFHCFLYIVCETTLTHFKSLDKQTRRQGDKFKINIPYILHNMRLVQHEFPNNCQFIFSGSRERSAIASWEKIMGRGCAVFLGFIITHGLVRRKTKSTTEMVG